MLRIGWSRFTSFVCSASLLAACGASTRQSAAPPAVAQAHPVQLATSVDNTPQPTSDQVPVGSDDAVLGSANAPVTLVEFSDLQCPFCARVEPTVQELEREYGPDKLRIVFKHNPLPFHANARPAAKVAVAVLHQGGSVAFFKFLDLAFSEQDKLGEPATLSDWVRRVGLDPALVMPRAELQETTAQIDRDAALAAQIGANGTPAFRINGKTLSGALPIEQFKSIIDAELAAAAALTKSGTPVNAVYRTRVAANFAAPKPPEADEDDDDLSIWKVPIDGAPAEGPKDALVTIVEFYDYQCPFCRHVQPTLEQLLARYPNDLRIIRRQNPLPFHARALPAANLALEARAEKGDAGFLDATRGLFDDQHGLEDSDLMKLAKDLKLNEKRVEAAIKHNTHRAEIEADEDVASDLHAAGTPYFFINGLRLSGAQPLESFVTAIDAQLKVANALVAAGTPRARVYDEILSHAKENPPPEQRSIPKPSADNPARGPANAPVVIHEFADFQCPFCERVENTLHDLEQAFPGKLRFVWHDLPLPFHQHAVPAALVAREARAEKGDAAFWKIHDLLFRDQADKDAFSAQKYAEYASALVLNASKLQAAPSDARFTALIEQDKAIAAHADIAGTPAFVINGYYVSGAQPLSVFKRAVRNALSEPKKKVTAASATPRSKP